MADQIYYSVFTKQGLALLTQAIQNGTKLGITAMAFGDGGGSLPEPNENFTSLIHEVHRTQLNSLAPDPNNANWLRAEAIIASATGGFNIRELGLYAGDILVAYSNYPATYKPNPADGTARIMTFRMILQIDNVANFELVIDPDVVLATIQFVDNKFNRAISTVETIVDLSSINPFHGQTVTVKGYHHATNFALAKPYKGGGVFVYDSALAEINDAGIILNGWVRQDIVSINPYLFGAKGGFIKDVNEVDDTIAFRNSIKSAVEYKYYKVHVPTDDFLITDELLLNGIEYTLNQDIPIQLSRDRWENIIIGCELVGDGALCSNIIFKPALKDSVCLAIRGGWGTQSRRHIRRLSILPYDREEKAVDDETEAKGIAIELQGCCFTHIEDVYIDRFNIGLKLHNKAYFDFTEFNRFDRLNSFCSDICIDFHVSHINATPSFHGNNFTNTRVQINKNNGIGVRGYGEHNLCMPYNCQFDINAYGGEGYSGEKHCYFIHLTNCRMMTMAGDMTSEGAVKFFCDDLTSSFTSVGTYQSLGFPEPQWEVGNFYSHSGIAAFTWSNVSSTHAMAGDDIIFNSDQYKIRALDPSRREATGPYIARVIARDIDENTANSTADSLVFVNESDDVLGWTFAKSKGPATKAKDIISTWNFNYDGLGIKALGGNWLYLTTKAGSTWNFKPEGFHYNTATDTCRLGLSNRRWFELHTTSARIDSLGIIPTITSTYSLGAASTTWNNIYTQNAVTVVSDRNHKTDICELNEAEIACARACAKLYRKYKLNAAIEQKTESDARYHLGAIAQDIVQCFTDHGLDWHAYGIITYEAWDAVEAVEYQAATHDNDGNELTPEVQHVEAKAAGEIYMMRYEEFNCFVNAGIEAMLSDFESRLASLESKS